MLSSSFAISICMKGSRTLTPGRDQGFHVPQGQVCRVRCLLSSGGVIDHEDELRNHLPLFMLY